MELNSNNFLTFFKENLLLKSCKLEKDFLDKFYMLHKNNSSYNIIINLFLIF